jgi:hypothetical protein
MIGTEAMCGKRGKTVLRTKAVRKLVGCECPVVLQRAMSLFLRVRNEVNIEGYCRGGFFQERRIA